MNRTPLSLILALGVWSGAQAAHATFEQARHIRAEIELNAADLAEQTARVREKIKLPTSRFFGQGHSNLCWIYGTLSALETNYRVQKPEAPALELSRTYLQYRNWQDRYLREFQLGDHYVREGGTTVDAIALMRGQGIVAMADYTQRPKEVPVDHPFQVSGDTLSEFSLNLVRVLDRELGALPAVTHLEGNVIAPVDLTNALLGDSVWEAYGFSDDGSEGYADHWDPDARSGTKAYFFPKAKFYGVIHESLRRGHALGISLCGHDIEMYGGEWDEHGEPLAFFVKDSMGDGSNGFWAIDPEKARTTRHLCGVSTIKL